MHFLNPKTDFAFKKIFGSRESKDILLSFINAMLRFRSGHEIVDLTIIDPYQAPKIKGIKDTYLDVKAESKDGREFIIEMQVLNVAGFEKRILYNAAKSYSIQKKRKFIERYLFRISGECGAKRLRRALSRALSRGGRKELLKIYTIYTVRG